VLTAPLPRLVHLLPVCVLCSTKQKTIKTSELKFKKTSEVTFKMNAFISNKNDASGVVPGGVAAPRAAGVVPGAGAAGAGVSNIGNVPIVHGVGSANDTAALAVVAESGRDDVADILGVPRDAAAPRGVHGHGLSSGGVPAVPVPPPAAAGGGALAGSAVDSGSVVAVDGVVVEAGLVPPPAAIVPVVAAAGGGIVGPNPNNPALVPAAGGALGAAIVPAPAWAEPGHANPPPEGHHIIQIPYFDLCYSSGDEERNLPVLQNIKIKIEPGTE